MGECYLPESVLRRLWEKVKLLWKLAKSERATPREIGWAVAIGAFAGCTPAIGFHGPLAMGMATLARKNRLFAWLGSRISNMVFLPFIALAEVQISYRARTGAWLVIDRAHVVDQAPHLLLDWCIGMFPVGGLIGAVMGFLAYGLALRRDKRRRVAAERAEIEASEKPPPPTPPTPAELPPPSSGSPA